MTTLDLDKLPPGLRLTTGHHNVMEGEGCAMDAIAWAATDVSTDMPDCVHPLLARLVHRINDDPIITNLTDRSTP